MTAEDEKTSIGRMRSRIIPIQEMLWLFLEEPPTGVECFRENIVGHFNREEGKRVLFQVFAQRRKPSCRFSQYLSRQAEGESIGKGMVAP
jgi:hypothetical protein